MRSRGSESDLVLWLACGKCAIRRAIIFTNALAVLISFAISCQQVHGQALVDTQTVRDEHRLIHETYVAELREVADRLTAAGDDAAAKQVRSWAIPMSRNRDWLYVPPQSDSVQEDLTNLGIADGAEIARFTELREQHAQRLWELAGQAAVAGQASLAVQLASHTLREDPNHVEACKLLGVDDPSPAPTTGVANTRHKTYGWESGQYRWARSAHFQLLTSCDEQVALSLLSELETLHSVWRQLFTEFALTTDTFARGWSKGVLPSGSRSRHRVVLFSNRDEYVSQLKHLEPQIALSQGLYRHQQRTAFFFAAEPLSLANVRHEVTHQLFHEAIVYGDTRGAGANVAETQDFWVIEGIAMFMESLRTRDGLHHGCYTVGGPDADRLQFARHRALSSAEHTPLATFTMLGRESLQTDSRIGQLYSQACGLAHFLMLGDDSRYRPAFIEYLRDVYDRNKSDKTIAQRLQVSFEELDHAYADFLSVTDNDLGDLDRRTDRLSLGNTRVTDAGIAHLPELKELKWLDLSSTAVTDASLPEIAKLKQLSTLWLANTTISDKSILHLQSLEKLTELDLCGTSVTQQGRVRLRATFPSLELLPEN